MFFIFAETAPPMEGFFAKREIRALAVLLPILCVGAWITVTSVMSSKPSEEETAVAAESAVEKAVNPVPFDPNTICYEELRAMGVQPKIARNIVKYRAAGMVYEIPEDVAAVYGVSDSLYAALKPYIRIAPEFRIKSRPETDREYGSRRERRFTQTEFDPNTLDADGFYALGCFTRRQSVAMAEYRDRIGGFRSAEELADCYLIGDSLYAQLKPYVKLSLAVEPVKPKTDLNTADSVALVAVHGIGPRTARDIILYRRRLGGFARIDQLKELASVTERNFELMKEEIWCDSCKIQKIDINFAPPKELAGHPYLTPERIRRILKQRQLKGGWSTIEDLVEENILTPREACMLAPYLQFNPAPKE